MKNQQPEHRLQCAIVDYLRLRGFWPVAVPNGAVIAGNARQRAMRIAFLKASGMTPGFPDLIVYAPGGRVGHIEVKAEGGRQTETQREAQHKLSSLGHAYAVCRSIEDVEETLVEWGWVTALRSPDGARLRPVGVAA